jgi:hypothetical protein
VPHLGRFVLLGRAEQQFGSSTVVDLVHHKVLHATRTIVKIAFTSLSRLQVCSALQPDASA